MSGRSLDDELAAARAAGDRLAVATVVEGRGSGRRMLVWPGGQCFGDLGAPRLNQRVALYLETLLEHGGRGGRKTFDGKAGTMVVEVEVHG